MELYIIVVEFSNSLSEKWHGVVHRDASLLVNGETLLDSIQMVLLEEELDELDPCKWLFTTEEKSDLFIARIQECKPVATGVKHVAKKSKFELKL